jgi:hypothetical protein
VTKSDSYLGDEINEDKALSGESLIVIMCQCLGTILTGFRRQLRGRHHLVLPVLQNGLRYFFSPDLKYSTHKIALSRPGTVSENESGRIKSARAFARVLTTFCDPSEFALSKNSSKNSTSHIGSGKKAGLKLTSKVERYRKTLAKFVPFILFEYIQGQLRNPLPPSIRKQLMPGIYELLGLVDEDTLGMMSAAVDSSGRTLLKDLWSERARARP